MNIAQFEVSFECKGNWLREYGVFVRELKIEI